MKVSDLFSLTAQSCKSIVKVLLLSRPSSVKNLHPDGPVIIMANGPSLNETIAESADILKANDTLSVNFAPTAPVFRELKPRFHVMADPLFFCADKPENVRNLYRSLAEVDWPLTLFVPYGDASKIPAEVTGNPNITVAKFNFVGAEGFAWLENFLYSRRLAMPRPRNVLVPALMCAIWSGYREICIVGADHSWMQTISVDDDNNVISVQPHFYKDDSKEQKRIDSAYRNYRLHDIVYSFSVAFRSYHTVERYARKKGIRVYNCTPSSFIDAFRRSSLTRFFCR